MELECEKYAEHDYSRNEIISVAMHLFCAKKPDRRQFLNRKFVYS